MGTTETVCKLFAFSGVVGILMLFEWVWINTHHR